MSGMHPDQDAELIAACEEYMRIREEFDAAAAAISGDLDADSPVWNILGPSDGILDTIIRLRATTDGGIAARAKCAALHYRPGYWRPSNDPGDADDERLRAALMRDVVEGRYGECVALEPEELDFEPEPLSPDALALLAKAILAHPAAVAALSRAAGYT